jgi:Outer membrane protein beta-barrel family
MTLSSVHGQTPEIPTGSAHGRIHDSTLNKDCPLVVVAILRLDSTLLQFTRTRKDGSFSFQDIPVGNYLLMISHPSYSDYTGRLSIKENSLTELGTVFLEPRADSLSAVVVTPRTPPVHIRGDTLEYNTGNIKMKVNATVEELLSRLPGVQIDENGVITVNGKRVERLLVDGEDFFSGDPTIVTRNFNADMIAKVQILDKKSNQAEFTGVDDGQRTKTVNLVLKEDAKKGYFAKVEAGDDPQGYYNANGLLGSFKGKRQLAVLAIAANNGATGLGGGGLDVGTGLSLGSGQGDALGASAGGGIPKVEAAGAHYADKWNGNEDHISGNASLGHLTTQPYSSSIIQQTLPDSIYTQVQNKKSINSIDQQSFNANFDYLPDSLSAFGFSVGGMKTSGNNQLSSTGNSSFNDTLVNSSLGNIHDLVSNQSFRGNMMYRLRDRKKKTRNFSVTAGVSRQTNMTNGYLYVLNNFYHPDGSLLSADTTDQRKVISNSNINLNSSLNYTEPVWKGAILALSYGLTYSGSQSQQITFGRGDGKYQDYIDSLSSHYQNNVLSQRATINLQTANNRLLNYTIGGDILQYANRQKDLLKDSVTKYQYITFAPRANLRYAVNTTHSISFDYSANTQQPSITQLQPVQNNNNPLYITLGNPNLRPSFSQSFGLAFDAIKPIFLNLGINFGYTNNAISTKTYTDSLGRQISQAVNVSGSESGGLNFSLDHKLMPIGLDLGLNGNASLVRSVNYVGNLLSNNDTYTAGGGVLLGKYVPDHYSFRINSMINYSFTRSSVNIGAITRYWTQSQNVQLSYFPLPGLEINTNGFYNWRQKTSVFDKNNSTFLWNAFVSRNFLQNRLVIKWRINDILGQNAGIFRNISGNTISQNSTNIIGRYWMLSATYRFERHGKLK